MSKKLIASSILALGLLVSVNSASAATTVKYGMKSADVTVLQAALKVTPATGYFGKITLAAVKAFQTAHNLKADGIVGPMTWAAINAAGVTTPTTGSTGSTTPSTTVSGGAGDAEMTHYATSEKSKLKEGESDVKVLGFKIEAMDSDISLSNVKVAIKNTQSPLTSSYRLTKYVDSVDLYKGSTKIGSANADDFTKSSSDVYTKSIPVSNAVVKEGDKDIFYVVLNAVDNIESENSGFKLHVAVDSYRFVDGAGVVTTNTPTVSDNITNDVTSDSSVDAFSVKTSSNNPDDETVTVKENNTSDETLALAFKLKADSDSSDVTLLTLPVDVKIVGAGATVLSSEKIIDSIVLKIDGKEITGDVASATISNDGATKAQYTFDLDGEDVVIASGETMEAKVYVTFAEQGGTGSGKNYADGLTKVTVSTGTVKAESKNKDNISSTGTQTGAAMTLNTSAITLSNISWTKAEGQSAATIDLFFSITAGDNDVTGFDIADVATASSSNVSAGVLTKISGTATENPGGTFAIGSGDTANFRVRYATTATAAEVNVSTIAGQTVPDTKKLSPTAYWQ